ncbi:MAG: ATP-binding cassette domain-containing protein [Vicinamibacteria bacterium]|nr:ATP-binding cassette domain-containing protein [Vicinamibacteria bacterium]
MSWAIQIEGVSKLYRYGANGPATDTLRDAFRAWWRSRSAPPEEAARPSAGAYRVLSPRQFEGAPPAHFWALRDIHLEIPAGERVGIVGRNGSGKSTLLKILSRVTGPTEGRFRYRGRVISMLEVGTGFHGDLSGRENVYLNAQINGMTRKGIERLFHEIVEFSELGAHIDTPVKHYSSGMYLRLAFAVAAHLESEILIVDEVLAVGDAGFQKKCTERMLQVSGQGRTVIFVSHNLDAVNTLCTSAVELDHGHVVPQIVPLQEGPGTRECILAPVRHVTARYLEETTTVIGERSWPDNDTAPMIEDNVRLRSVRALGPTDEVRTEFDLEEPIRFEMRFEVLKRKYPLYCYVRVFGGNGEIVLVTLDNLDFPDTERPREPGVYVESVEIPPRLLNEGLFSIEATLCTFPTAEQNTWVANAVCFSVADRRKPGGVRGNWIREWPQSLIRPRLHWRHSFTPAPEHANRAEA